MAKVVPDITTSVFDVFPKLETLKLQPNPSNGQFMIQNLADDELVKIYNTSAQEVQFSRKGEKLDILNATPGIYVVIVKADNGPARYGKLVVN